MTLARGRIAFFLILVWLASTLSCREKRPDTAVPVVLPPVGEDSSALVAARPPERPAPGASSSAPRESEPTAAGWKTILLSSPADIPVPAPPVSDERRELTELRKLSAGTNSAALEAVSWWDVGGVRRWNEIARGLATSEHMNSPNAARMFALLAVAQYDALVTAWYYKYRFKRLAPAAAGVRGSAPVQSPERFSYPSGAAAVAAASASVLSYVMEPQSKFLWRNAEIHRDSRVWAAAVYPSDATAGWEIGIAVGRKVREWGDADGARTAALRPIPKQDEKWWTARQTMPGWGNVRPWLMKSVTDFRAPEPPAAGSPQFEAALREVRLVADSRSAEQLLLARYWDFGVETISVPGMWDEVGIDLMTRAGFSAPRMARALALANMAMMDASIACWETKFHYLVRRPTMMDPEIVTAMDVPEHPSYPSGHAAFSGAASAVLGYVLPEKARWLDELAEQAAMSRLYGGLHYRFDNNAGLKMGRAVAQLAIARARQDGGPPL